MEISAPLELHSDIIRPEWIDYNGHMNLAYYVLVFDYATDEFLEYIGLNEQYRAVNKISTFTGEMHVNYLAEVHEGDKVRITTQLLAYDTKRIHYFHRMYHADKGYLAATNELLSLYIDMDRRRVGCMSDPILERLGEIVKVHDEIPFPEQAGHINSIKKPV